MKINRLIGCKPGLLHLGNFLGTFQPFFQSIVKGDDLDGINIIYVADLHLLATNTETKKEYEDLTKFTINKLIQITIYFKNKFKELKNSKIYIIKQSEFIKGDIWNISRIISKNKLERIYKLNGYNSKNNLCAYLYPILMTYDVISIKPKFLILGIDQKINWKFIEHYVLKVFKKKSIITPIFHTRIPNLYDLNFKMSKSDSKHGIIYLDSTLHQVNPIRDIISKVKTSTHLLSSIAYLHEIKEFENIVNIACMIDEYFKIEDFFNINYNIIKDKIASIITILINDISKIDHNLYINEIFLTLASNNVEVINLQNHIQENKSILMNTIFKK